MKVKCKVVPALKHHAKKMYGGVEVTFHAFLTSAVDGGEWLVTSYGRSPPRYGRDLGL
jgi:hypothetical protein